MLLSERKNKRYIIVLDQYDENLGRYIPKSHTIEAPTLVEALINCDYLFPSHQHSDPPIAPTVCARGQGVPPKLHGYRSAQHDQRAQGTCAQSSQPRKRHR